MKTMTDKAITIETTVKAPVKKAWDFWTKPEHITRWNAASDDWHSPWAENDLRAGGKFASRMEAKDGSMGFDFGGTYDDVQEHKLITYTMSDGRRVEVHFHSDGNQTRIVESFDPESENPVDFQRNGWQAILDNYKKYTEAN